MSPDSKMESIKLRISAKVKANATVRQTMLRNKIKHWQGVTTPLDVAFFKNTFSKFF
jgi:hypothetical protein